MDGRRRDSGMCQLELQQRNLQGVAASTLSGSARCIYLLQCIYPAYLPYLELHMGNGDTILLYMWELCERFRDIEEVSLSGKVNVGYWSRGKVEIPQSPKRKQQKQHGMTAEGASRNWYYENGPSALFQVLARHPRHLNPLHPRKVCQK